MSATRVMDVVGGQVQALVADSELVTLLAGQHVYERMSEDEVAQIPGVYWYILPLTLEENYERCIVRWDVYAPRAIVFDIENCIRRLLHSDVPVTVGEVATFSLLVQSFDVNEGEMGQDDISHRVIEIEVQPVRQRART